MQVCMCLTDSYSSVFAKATPLFGLPSFNVGEIFRYLWAKHLRPIGANTWLTVRYILFLVLRWTCTSLFFAWTSTKFHSFEKYYAKYSEMCVASAPLQEEGSRRNYEEIHSPGDRVLFSVLSRVHWWWKRNSQPPSSALDLFQQNSLHFNSCHHLVASSHQFLSLSVPYWKCAFLKSV